MRKYCSPFATVLAFALGITTANAGTIFYQAIPALESDVNSGISSDNQYTSAVDGGNTRGPDRVINGITLYALAADGESATADNCTVNALAGNLSNAGGVSPSIQADGTFKDALSDMTFNNGATDNSEQEIVLDPESLEEGATYDLRVYVCNSSGQNRQVNLSFVGDGQPAVETGFFNEDDARTSAGGFKDTNQVYYINYRFIWDGDSTPGITITQKSGSAPFILYALTNQVVPGAGLATQPGEPQGRGLAQGGPGIGQGQGEGEGGEGEGEGEGGDEGLTSGFINQESDEIGVESEEFYGAESLNSNGQWIDVDKWGNCWQPTNVPAGWSPYTNGNWKECEDCGWTFDSEEPWAWATYHYGRWCKVRRGCGWAWVPGKVWGASWVSWRRGQSGSSCDSCIGWAPLPPEAGCEVGVGISSWVDNTCDIGPDCYTFVNIRDFGCCPSYSGCGSCIIDRGTYINIYEASINITNICYDRNVNIYCGGPDYNWCNTEIRRRGGKECERIHVNRYDDPGRIKGGKHWNKEGNQLALHSPKINGNKNAKHPKIAEHLGKDKIDKGWGSAKANNKEKQLKNHLAQETKGKTPKNTKGNLPPGVAEKQKQHAAAAGQQGGRHPGGKGKGQGQMGAGAGQAAGGGVGQHPGGKGKFKGQGAMGAGAGQAAGGGFNQHPGGRGKGKGQGQMGAGAGQAGGGGFNQHPGKGHKGGKAGAGAAGLGAQNKGRGVGGGQGGQMAGGGGGGKGMHPGQKKSQRGQGGMGQAGAGGAQGGAGGGGQHPGKRGGKGGQQFGQGGNQAGGQGAAGGQAGAGGGRGKGGKHKQQQAQQPAGQQGGFGGAGGGGQKHRKQQKAQQAQQAQQPAGQQGGFGGAGGGGQKHRKQKQAQQPAGQQGRFGGAGGGGQKHRKQQQVQQPAGQQGGFGGAGGGGQKHRKQQQAQQRQQPAGRQGAFGGAGGGGQKHRAQQQQQVQQRPRQGGGQQPAGQQQQGQGKKKGKKTPPPF